MQLKTRIIVYTIASFTRSRVPTKKIRVHIVPKCQMTWLEFAIISNVDLRVVYKIWFKFYDSLPKANFCALSFNCRFTDLLAFKKIIFEVSPCESFEVWSNSIPELPSLNHRTLFHIKKKMDRFFAEWYFPFCSPSTSPKRCTQKAVTHDLVK